VYRHGLPQLHRLWDRDDLLRGLYRAPLFEPEHLRRLRLLPTEYVYYYYRSGDAYEHVKRAGTSRGTVISGLNRQLFTDLRVRPDDAVSIYERYLATRNAGYMQLESGAMAPVERSPWAGLTGYDKIALHTVRGIHFNQNAIIPLNVENRGNLPDLEPADVVEVPCVVNANGALPVHVGPVPDTVRDLVMKVKSYERATVAAGLSQSTRDAVAALTENPLVADERTAAAIVSKLMA
jgi:6-phospho-beta-glucosidase